MHDVEDEPLFAERAATCCCPSGVTWPRPGGSSPGRCAPARSRLRSPPTAPRPIRGSSTG